MAINVSQLVFYPVKSCAGTSLKTANIGLRGIVKDRHWMIVDGDGVFLSQRKLPAMSLIKPKLSDDGTLSLQAPGMEDFQLTPGNSNGEVNVQVWKDVCRGIDEGLAISDWLSTFLNFSCRMVRMADNFCRQVDQDYARPTDQVGFADGFPFLLISEASLADLNGRLAEPLPMNRFRPNIVVTGTTSFEEDTWTQIKIGALTFDVVKPCARCTITTVDQATGVQGSEPLKALAKFRLFENRILFGQNLVHSQNGTIAVGDAVQVLSDPERS